MNSIAELMPRNRLPVAINFLNYYLRRRKIFGLENYSPDGVDSQQEYSR
jgi:hypothetical protein